MHREGQRREQSPWMNDEATYRPLTDRVVPLLSSNRVGGLVVRRPPRERKLPGSNPACNGFFFRGRVIPVT